LEDFGNVVLGDRNVGTLRIVEVTSDSFGITRIYINNLALPVRRRI
jgi:hypothetical protein